MGCTFAQVEGSKTAIVTGGANGIGAEITGYFCSLGVNVVIADLASARTAAEQLIRELPQSSKAIYVATNIVAWEDVTALFRQASQHFGQVDIVVANAGIMETTGFFDFEMNDDGSLKEDSGASRVIDVNLKGTMNTLRQAMFHMKSNPRDEDGFRGSILLVTSTSGYFGGTAVVSYVASKHGVVGLLRASQTAAQKLGVRVNAVAPFITPTFITEGYSRLYRERGLPLNTPESVASAIAETSLDPQSCGKCFMVVRNTATEIEESRSAAVASYMSPQIKESLDLAKDFFDELGGYPLPQARV